MEITGEYRIPAPRQKVWEALNDAAILKVCIDGCEELEWSGENELSAKVRAKVGPVSARFAGKVWLSDLDPPRSYVLNGQGQGGAAGFAKGSATVELEEVGPEETILRYSAKAQVGGKLASVGSRLVHGVAEKTAAQFFERFTARLSVSLTAAGYDLRDVEETKEEAFPVGPVEYPEDILAERHAAAQAAQEVGAPGEGRGRLASSRSDSFDGRIPLDASAVIIPTGWGLALLVLILLFAL